MRCQEKFNLNKKRDKIEHANSKHLTPGTPSPKGEGDILR